MNRANFIRMMAGLPVVAAVAPLVGEAEDGVTLGSIPHPQREVLPVGARALNRAMEEVDKMHWGEPCVLEGCPGAPWSATEWGHYTQVKYSKGFVVTREEYERAKEEWGSETVANRAFRIGKPLPARQLDKNRG